MIRASFKRPRDWSAPGHPMVRALRRRVLTDLVAGLRAMQDSIMLTPVYTGRTLVNYRWSLDSPVHGVRAPVKDPALPGKTSDLAIGREPRRNANSAQLREEFAVMLAGLRADAALRSVHLVNDTPYFDQVEYGTYSTSEGGQQRTPPGGITRRGEATLEALVLGLRRRGSSV